MEGQMENLPIIQDFVPYRGRCSASPHENQGEEQGKGTADHLMPLGYLLLLRIRNLKIPEVAPISD